MYIFIQYLFTSYLSQIYPAASGLVENDLPNLAHLSSVCPILYGKFFCWSIYLLRPRSWAENVFIKNCQSYAHP